MGWIGDLIKGIAARDAKAFVVTDALKREDAAPPEALEDDKCYLELFIDAMWLPKARRFSSELHGVVHVFSEVQRLGEGKAQIAYVSAPSELAKVDGKAINKVIVRSQKALGPVPWRGQELKLEMGLFSVKSSDLAAPYLDLMDTLSGQAGVSFLSAAAPFVPVLRKGVELLVGKDGEASLEIGLDKGISAPRTGSYAIVAADQDQLDETALSVRKDGTLMRNGAMVRDYPWLVFRISKSTQRADFGTIPDVKAAWDTFRATLRSRKRADAADALSMFRVVASTSPDLIEVDADRLGKLADDMMTRSFASVPQGRPSDGPVLPDLVAVDLYPAAPGGG